MKVLIRSPNWIGDAVLSTVIIKPLRKYFKEGEITILAKPYVIDVWKNNHYINKVVEYTQKFSLITKLRNEKFDIAIILPLSFSSAFHIFLCGVKERIGYPTEHRGVFLTQKVSLPKKFRTKHLTEEYLDILKFMKIPVEEKELILEVSSDDVDKAESILTSYGIKKEDKLIGISPGATYGPSKMWQKEKFISLIKRLVKNYDVKILIFGSKEEEKLINKIYTEVGERSYPIIGLKLSILIGIIKTCRLLVSNDSGIMHISSAVKVPTVGIFGSTSPVWTAPIGENNEIVYKSLSCSPCFKRYCKRKDYACLNEISVEEVEEKVKKLLKLT